MNSEKSSGRAVGVVLILQMISALILPFVLMGPLVRGYPAFLDTAAASAGQIRAAVAIAFFGLGLTVALAVLIYPIIARYSQRSALWFLAICIISAAVDLIHSGTVLTMLAVSERLASAGGSDLEVHQAWGAMAASLRRSIHIVQLVAIGAWIATFYSSLLRFRLAPRPLAIIGLIATASQFIGVTLMMFIGNSPIGYLAMPIGVVQLITGIWLIAKGFPSSDGVATRENP